MSVTILKQQGRISLQGTHKYACVRVHVNTERRVNIAHAVP